MKRVHTVGCPRSGTTLLMELMSACYAHDAACEHEESVFVAPPRDAQVYFSKQPTDILNIHRVLDQDKGLHVLYIVRDPRAVISSLHHSNRDIYFCNYYIWKKCETAARRLDGHPRFLTLRYEDLVTSPDACQRDIESAMPWLQRQARFSEFEKFARPPEDAVKAMDGVRAIDTASLTKWHKHLPRIKEQLDRHPEMHDDLIYRRYEADREWLTLLADVQPVQYACRYPEKDNPLKEAEKSLRMWWRARRYINSLTD